jgi:fatty acid/phospholipid biosynthesis enzyme
VKKPVIKAHGSSDDYLFYFTLKQAEKFVKSNAVPMMIKEFEKTKMDED